MATDVLHNRIALNYLLDNQGSLDLFLRFLNNPAMIFTHAQELRNILELAEQATDGETSGDTDLAAKNLTDLE